MLMPDADRLPWPRLLEIAYGVLRLTPETFWSMTPCEWMSGLKGWKESHGSPVSASAITRQEMLQLMARFPDQGMGY